MEMNSETIKALLDAFESSDWQEMTITMGADRLHVSRDPSTNGAMLGPVPPPASASPARVPPAAPSPPPAAEPPATAPLPAAPVDAVGTVIASPSVGLFWCAP